MSNEMVRSSTELAFVAIAATLVLGAACNRRPFEYVDHDGRCRPSDVVACQVASSPVVPEVIVQGLAGVVASESDVARGDGCLPCSFTTWDLAVYATDEQVVDPGAAADVIGTVSPLAITVEERYEVSVDTGFYLVCAGNECAPVEVLDQRVTTAGVIVGFGSARIFTFAPDGTPGPESFAVGGP
ncbi:MAG: hypothetical protein IT383_12185 [Deltaproteobacteria bacterium]|nr:hypothetical protein [Deltaproteobacteria bacterium]